MADDMTLRDALLDAALELISERGWRDLSLADVARHAAVPLGQAAALFPTKAHLLAAQIARTDQRVLDSAGTGEGEGVRDRLFDMIMQRLDTLQPHRKAIASMLRDLPLDPATAAALLPRLAISMAWMLEAAGASPAGIIGCLRVQALGVIYLRTVRAWLSDDSADLAKTMATLDKALSSAESLASRLPFARSGGERAPDEPSAMAAEVAPEAPD
jgi:AcrR family transcriptional regulator